MEYEFTIELLEKKQVGTSDGVMWVATYEVMQKSKDVTQKSKLVNFYIVETEVRIANRDIYSAMDIIDVKTLTNNKETLTTHALKYYLT